MDFAANFGITEWDYSIYQEWEEEDYGSYQEW